MVALIVGRSPVPRALTVRWAYPLTQRAVVDYHGDGHKALYDNNPPTISLALSLDTIITC
jgi:hypothetical protein